MPARLQQRHPPLAFAGSAREDCHEEGRKRGKPVLYRTGPVRPVAVRNFMTKKLQFGVRALILREEVRLPAACAVNALIRLAICSS